MGPRVTRCGLLRLLLRSSFATTDNGVGYRHIRSEPLVVVWAFADHQVARSFVFVLCDDFLQQCLVVIAPLAFGVLCDPIL